MKIFIVVATLVVVTYGRIKNDVTGPTPKAVTCKNDMCEGKQDGNYAYTFNRHYFLQCVKGLAYCQSCWPSTLVYSLRCNQCLYSRGDKCATTQEWKPVTTTECPDMCPERGHDFDGNIEDPYNPEHYVACWKGVTVGCVQCPRGLQFNEYENACLYHGQFWTEQINHEFV